MMTGKSLARMARARVARRPFATCSSRSESRSGPSGGAAQFSPIATGAGIVVVAGRTAGSRGLAGASGCYARGGHRGTDLAELAHLLGRQSVDEQTADLVDMTGSSRCQHCEPLVGDLRD